MPGTNANEHESTSPPTSSQTNNNLPVFALYPVYDARCNAE